ncbi:hypothetical protein IAU60_005798 [Kwoniella sp. DSM 27419]
MSTPITRRHSEMPRSVAGRSTPTRKVSAVDTGIGSSMSRPRPNTSRVPATEEMRRGSSSASVSGTLEQRRARREQLRSFYGIKGDAGVPSGGEGGDGVKGDPLDIDSPAFNPSAYYEHLIAEQDLSGLMRKAASLGADIGNLEASRHSLVYNHHHQLFAAGDTISHLNSRTPQLLSIMAELQQSFSSISQLVDSIALPEAEDSSRQGFGGVDGQSADPDQVTRRTAERLKLMLRAEESPEAIIRAYESSRHGLDQLAARDESIRVLVERVQETVKNSATSVDDDVETTAE